MTETYITIGPVRPISGPLAKLGGEAISQGASGPRDAQQIAHDLRALQGQIFSISQLLNQLISVPMVIASGPNHQAGVVPDPGAVAGTARFLREDATWAAVSILALSGVIPTYASNALAIAGGLALGRLFTNGTGDVFVVF